MVQLTLAGLSEDGRRLLLVSDAGVEFTLDVDAKLRAALRGDSQIRARLGQLEIKMDSVLRPRDIQARIRAGESPETVAAAAQTRVEAIMPYAAPVLAEREHVAQRAQRASIRRPASSGAAPAGSRTLGDAIAGHLRAQNVDPGSVEWDAWRREDGRWTLTATYDVEARDVVQRGERPPAVLAAPGVPLDAARVDVVRPQLGGDGLAEGACAGLGRAATYGRELGPVGDVGALGHHGRGERHDLLHRRPGCVRHRLG